MANQVKPQMKKKGGAERRINLMQEANKSQRNDTHTQKLWSFALYYKGSFSTQISELS